MCTQTISAARWAAIESLQKRRSRFDVNSFGFRIADYAIDLVLSSDRPEGPFLVQNALRDARSILIRKDRRSRSRGMIPLLYARSENDPLEESAAVSADHTAAALRPVLPELNLLQQESFEHLCSKVGESNRYGPEVLTGWFIGEAVDETAARLKISSHYVKKLRAQIRVCAANDAVFGRAA